MELSGALNNNSIQEINGYKMVVRSPKGDDSRCTVLKGIESEYCQAGFGPVGVSFRTPFEQIDFSNYMADMQLPALRYENCPKLGLEILVSKFIQGVPLDKCLEGLRVVSVKPAILNILKFHEKGVIVGDRWVKNTMIKGLQDFPSAIEIDFDLELDGAFEHLVNVELAQTLFHIVHFSNGDFGIVNEGLGVLSDISSVRYSFQEVGRMIKGQASYFKDIGFSKESVVSSAEFLASSLS